MTPRDFAYWLQGFFEVADTDDVKPEQIRMIKEHLSLVLTKVTPAMEEPKVDYPPFQPSRFIDERIICSAIDGIKPFAGIVASPTILNIPAGESASAYGESLASRHAQLKTPPGKYHVDTGIKCQLTC